MQTFLRRFSVVAGFALLVLLLVGDTLITKRQLDVQVENEGWVLRSHQVLYEIEQTESLLLEAETGQRGYVLTGEARYLKPYSRAAGQVEGHLANLAQLTSGQAAEQANAAQLRIYADQKLDELRQTVALFRTGRADQTKAIIATDRGLIAMDNVRRTIRAMQLEESSLEAERSTAYRRSVEITNACIAVTTIVAIVGLVLLAYLILRERELRDRHYEEINAREQWFRVTLTSIGDAVIATDGKGNVTFMNPVAEHLTGIPAAQAIGKSVLSVFPIFNEFTGNAAENPVTKVMALGTVVGLANHTALRHADGRMIPIEDSAAPIRNDNQQLIGVVLVFHDVSAERKSQDILRKTEKLATAARLSATVAHEINNPLEAVINLIFIARNDPEAPPAVVRQLNMAEQEIERVAHITRQTLGFYRESISPEQIQIDRLIDSVLKMYSSKLESNGIRVQCAFGACPSLLAVAGELKQVFSNVIANAIDAAGRKGSIFITTQSLSCGDQSMVEVTVADSGSGIAADHIDRIFEPFFTTKKDVGTGLGLWVTREIVERHGGTIQVQPAIGGDGPPGAAFVLQLPCESNLEPNDVQQSAGADCADG
ncbi:MAG TPA: CHASE3 domain-containing protein [Terracidiphilus sp.]|jgi:PAS domain S-box-containing protein|nr:CHASE3 domain-containing protein [Terracidiphilus sp.]